MHKSYQIIKDQEHINFLNQQKFDIYVQHPLFGEFNQELNDEYFCFAAMVDNQVKVSSLCILIKAKRGNFLYLPYGPVYSPGSEQYLADYFQGLKSFAKSKNCSFVRFSPYLESSQENMELFQAIGARKAPMHMIAEHTCVLDLEGQSPDSLLKAMNKNHRNLIRKALKTKDLAVRVSTNIQDIALVAKMLETTAKRHKFVAFSQKYLETEFRTLAKIQAGKIYLAYYKDELVACAIMYQFGSSKVYKHGASTQQYRNLPSSYLIQWQSILDALESGIKNYNFWGVAPSKEAKKHPFYGITHFKLGFGAKQINLLPALDLPITIFYCFNWIVETLRRLKRGF